MKKNNIVVAVFIAVAFLLGGALGLLLPNLCSGANYSDEMKLDYRTDYADGGANAVIF